MESRPPDSPPFRHVKQGQGRVRFGLDLLKMGLLCVLILMCVGCSVRPEVQRKDEGAIGYIPFPAAPERVEIEKPGEPKKPGVTYVEPPLQLKPNQVFRAYKDGALVFKPRDWRGINHVVTEWPRWADTMQSIIDQVNKHNKSLQKKSDSERSWFPWR